MKLGSLVQAWDLSTDCAMGSLFFCLNFYYFLLLFNLIKSFVLWCLGHGHVGCGGPNVACTIMWQSRCWLGESSGLWDGQVLAGSPTKHNGMVNGVADILPVITLTHNGDPFSTAITAVLRSVVPTAIEPYQVANMLQWGNPLHRRGPGLRKCLFVGVLTTQCDRLYSRLVGHVRRHGQLGQVGSPSYVVGGSM